MGVFAIFLLLPSTFVFFCYINKNKKEEHNLKNQDRGNFETPDHRNKFPNGSFWIIII